MWRKLYISVLFYKPGHLLYFFYYYWKTIHNLDFVQTIHNLNFVLSVILNSYCSTAYCTIQYWLNQNFMHTCTSKHTTNNASVCSAISSEVFISCVSKLIIWLWDYEDQQGREAVKWFTHFIKRMLRSSCKLQQNKSSVLILLVEARSHVTIIGLQWHETFLKLISSCLDPPLFFPVHWSFLLLGLLICLLYVVYIIYLLI